MNVHLQDNSTAAKTLNRTKMLLFFYTLFLDGIILEAYGSNPEILHTSPSEIDH